MLTAALARKLLEVSMLASLFAAAAPSSAGTLIVGNKGAGTVSFLDPQSGAVRTTFAVGVGPHEVAVSPDGRTAVAANYGTGGVAGSTLSVIDVPAAKVLRTIDLAPYGRPHGMVVRERGRLFVTAEANRALLEVDLVAGKVVRAIPTGQELSHMVAVSADGARAYTANVGSGSVTALDLTAGKHLKDVRTGAGAEGIDVTPDGRQVWVANRGADTVSVVDAATLAVVATLPSPGFPIRVRITLDGRFALVSNGHSSDLSVFSVPERKLLRRLPVPRPAEIRGPLFGQDPGSVPVGLLLEPGGKRAFVAHSYGDFVSVVDLGEWKQVKTFKTGKGPDGMGYSAITAPVKK